MRGVPPVIALLLLLSACAQADSSLNAGETSSPTTANTTDGAAAMEESGTPTTVHDDMLSDPILPRVFVCPGGVSIQFEPYDDDRSTGSSTLTLEDGSEVFAISDWVELEAGFADSALLEFEDKTALRLVDRTTGDERACPEEGGRGSLPTGTDSAVIESCAVSPPWGVMGGQQVTYQGTKGNAGVVEANRNGSLVATMLVGVTWDNVLALRQVETSIELPGEDYQQLFGSPGEIFFSDFGSPSGELSYDLVVRDGAGTNLQRIDCGAVVVPSLESVTCSLDLLDGFPRFTISDGAFPQELRRNAERIEYSLSPGGLVDASAPTGVPLSYEVTVSALSPDGQSHTIQCGSITAQEVPLEERVRSLVHRIGPAHWYGEVTPICLDCDPGPLLLGWNPPKVYRWNGGAFTSIEDSSAPWLTSPGDVPQLLLDAIEAGLDVQAEFDGQELKQWTVDGEGASYRCVDGDTAPIEIRTEYHQTIVDSCSDDL